MPFVPKTKILFRTSFGTDISTIINTVIIPTGMVIFWGLYGSLVISGKVRPFSAPVPWYRPAVRLAPPSLLNSPYCSGRLFRHLTGQSRHSAFSVNWLKPRSPAGMHWRMGSRKGCHVIVGPFLDQLTSASESLATQKIGFPIVLSSNSESPNQGISPRRLGVICLG